MRKEKTEGDGREKKLLIDRQRVGYRRRENEREIGKRREREGVAREKRGDTDRQTDRQKEIETEREKGGRESEIERES